MVYFSYNKESDCRNPLWIAKELDAVRRKIDQARIDFQVE
jgi:hypothetical protein